MAYQDNISVKNLTVTKQAGQQDPRAVQATWGLANSRVAETEKFTFEWHYKTAGINDLIGNTGEITNMHPVGGQWGVQYSAPQDAISVWIDVTPIAFDYQTETVTPEVVKSDPSWLKKALTYMKNMGKSVMDFLGVGELSQLTQNVTVTLPYYFGTVKSSNTYAIGQEQLTAPQAPTTSISDTNVITASNIGIEIPTGEVESTFKVRYKLYQQPADSFDYNTTPIQVATSNVTLGTAGVMFSPVSDGYKYVVTAVLQQGSSRSSEESDLSMELTTRPSAPGNIYDIHAIKAEDVYGISLKWYPAVNAEQYRIKYADDPVKLDMEGTYTTIDTTDSTPQITIGNLDAGKTYYFQVATIVSGSLSISSWSGISYCALGTRPNPPTVSSVSTCKENETVQLNWIFNSKDNSNPVSSQVAYKSSYETVWHTKTFVHSTVDPTPYLSWSVAISDLPEGDVPKYGNVDFEWKVRTKGVYTAETGIEADSYSEFSETRRIKVYAQPSIWFEDQKAPPAIISSFPLEFSVISDPQSQIALEYIISIIAQESYTSLDAVGNEKAVQKGDVVYSKVIFGDEGEYNHEKDIIILPSDVSLQNGVDYTIKASVYMESGMSASVETDVTVEFEQNDYSVGANIGLNSDDLSAYIRPYILDEDGEEIDEDVLFSVYRRDYDGQMILIQDKVPSENNIYIVDPHPSLFFSDYRIIATLLETGEMYYTDVNGIPFLQPYLVFQWNEAMDPRFVTHEGPGTIVNPVNKSTIKLPYNLDTSFAYSSDVSTANYVGRRYPVNYYGTHIDETASFNVDIPAYDFVTLGQIRRLANWLGDVYVREPSGAGYWATVSVSFNKNHNELAIPISFNVTRVEGGA